jgi:3-oxoacyl-[acyl-carrier protein] reductase
MLRHAGRIALVTGGSGGIGQAIVCRLASEGARVIIADVADGSESIRHARAAGGEALWHRCDLSSDQEIRALAASVTRSVGAPGIFVHSAAVQFDKSFLELTTADWRHMQVVNQEAVFHFVQSLLPGMQAESWGRIILLASSRFYINGQDMAHYVTSKGALIGFARGLAGEVGRHGVTVNCLAPGLTRTANAAAAFPAEFFAMIAAQQAIKRSGTAEDQAGIVSFLASDDAAFITGQTILADGGQGRT